MLSPLVLHRGGTQLRLPAPPHVEEEEAKGFPDPDPQQLRRPPHSGDSRCCCFPGDMRMSAPSIFHLTDRDP